MADALFGGETKAGAQWFTKMRQWLKEHPQGAAQVARSAMQHLDARKMTKPQKTEFWKAYRYLRRHRRLMDYAGYRRRGLPIGSGVTEAACKTVFTQRFKRSGMRMGATKPGPGDIGFARGVPERNLGRGIQNRLAFARLPEPSSGAWGIANQGSHQATRQVSARLAA